MDEPTASIDSQIKREIYELLGELNAQMTIVMVSHDIGVVEHFCDRIAVMYEGQIVATLRGSQITDDTIVATSMRVR